MYKRLILNNILKRIQEPRQFIQVLIGPRQVGKTTLVSQLLEQLNSIYHFASADEVTLKDSVWLQQQWEQARVLLKENQQVLLIIDEIQKVIAWPAIVKKLWDEDSAKNSNIKVLLLGSSPLILQQGLTESLAGRFETIPITHWSFTEMQEAFGWQLEQYIYFGGYPGAASLIHDENRWRRYITDSLLETTISRDILLLARIDKPALLRRLFYLGCQYSGQILSYHKMLGQLQDVGNTTTLAHYLDLLSAVGMITGLSKFAGQSVRQRAASPKLQVFNTALMTALGNYDFEQAKTKGEYWGRLVESSVGSYILNQSIYHQSKVYYWREKNKEVDFIVQRQNKLIAIEVKSTNQRMSLSGLAEFNKIFKPDHIIQVGGREGLPIEKFLQTPLTTFLA